MQIRTRFTEDGALTVEVIDPTDGAVTHQADLAAGEQIVVAATAADSPADIEFGEVEAIPTEGAEPVDEDPPAPTADDEVEADPTPDDETPDDDEPTAA